MDEKIHPDAFIRTNTIHLSHAFKLHNAALNPNKDLVALYRNLPSAELKQRQMAKLTPNPFGRRVPFMPTVKRRVLTKFKGRGFETEEDEDQAAGAICIGLWRSISNSAVDDAAGPSVTPPIWEADVAGKQLLGMAWNLDGTILSVLALCHPKERSNETSLLKLAHLSLEDGSVADTSYITTSASDSLDAQLEMFWSTRPDGSQATKTEQRLLDVLGSLPQPNHVREYVPTPQAAYSHKRPATEDSAPKQEPCHSILGSFPASLKNVSTAAVLCIPGLQGSGESGASFLGGSFALPYSPETREVDFDRIIINAHLREEAPHTRPATDETTIAEASSAAKGYLNTILRGIQSCQGIWRDDIDKERIRWMDELEDAAKTHGTNFKTAHADLTRLLLTGRSGEAITQFLGGRITEKTLNAWETAHCSASNRIQGIIKYSVLPACERIILIVEFLIGLSIATDLPRIHLDLSDLKRSMEWARHLAIRLADLDVVLDEEARRFRDFTRWLRYEIARAAAGLNDEDSLPSVAHDILSVCDYLAVFPAPPSSAFFLTIEQQLELDWPQPAPPRERKDWDLARMMTARRETQIKEVTASISQDPGASRGPDQSSGLSKPLSSSGKILWSIADVLVHELARIFKSAIRPATTQVPSQFDRIRDTVVSRGGRVASRCTKEGKLSAYLLLPDVSRSRCKIANRVNSGLSLLVVYFWSSDNPVGTTYRSVTHFTPKLRPLDLDFFDEHEILITIESGPHPRSARYLAAVRLDSIAFEPEAIALPLLEEMSNIVNRNIGIDGAPSAMADLIDRACKLEDLVTTTADSRCMALNGRPNRRLICVSLSSGKEIGVFE